MRTWTCVRCRLYVDLTAEIYVRTKLWCTPARLRLTRSVAVVFVYGGIATAIATAATAVHWLAGWHTDAGVCGYSCGSRTHAHCRTYHNSAEDSEAGWCWGGLWWVLGVCEGVGLMLMLCVCVSVYFVRCDAVAQSNLYIRVRCRRRRCLLCAAQAQNVTRKIYINWVNL